MPMAYLVLRAAQADLDQIDDLVLRPKHAELLWNTLRLLGGVIVCGTALALPLAWLTTRADIPGRRIITLLAVMPLAVPGYVMAYALLAITGHYGMAARLFDLTLPRLGGYWGALLALTVTTFPYFFLNLRAGLRGVDNSLVESARALGCSGGEAFFRVVLPQLRPAFQSSALLVALHVLGDFGVVSLMRYETFSYALYLLYNASYDRTHVAWLALLMLTLTLGILFLEARLLRGLFLHRTGQGAGRYAPSPVRLGLWLLPAYALVALVVAVSLVAPLSTILYWLTQPGGRSGWSGIAAAAENSILIAGPAAAVAVVLALPLVYASVRRPNPVTRSMERIAHFGFATPGLAFALAVIFFSVKVTPMLYQTATLLILACAMHFMAEAIGPIRSALYQTPPRLEESARALGCGPVLSFLRVTLPLIRGGLTVSLALVFLSVMKELPLTIMLRPLDFETLATQLWDKTNEALFAEAAPNALLITAVSSGLVAVLLAGERVAPRRRPRPIRVLDDPDPALAAGAAV